MISIIVCSLHPSLHRTLLDNLCDTVGVPYEVIGIDNSAGRYSIFEAYNRGASEAKYDLLCFMHEDILFHTHGWGGIVAGKLANKEVGVIGVAGAVFKSKSPSPWWISDLEDQGAYLRLNLLQHLSSGGKRQLTGGAVAAAGGAIGGVTGGVTGGEAGQGDQELWNEVLVLDGVWLCCRREVWRETPFDEKIYNGFHFYDLDFSLAVHISGLRNYVSQEILLEHFSPGHMDRNWIRGAEIFHRKWRRALPMSVGDLPVREAGKLDLSAARNFLYILISNRHRGLRLWFTYWIKTAARNPFSKETYLTIMRYGRTWFK
jgi:hypothetical protein